jgi:hypothetical protein
MENLTEKSEPKLTADKHPATNTEIAKFVASRAQSLTDPHLLQLLFRLLEPMNQPRAVVLREKLFAVSMGLAELHTAFPELHVLHNFSQQPTEIPF